MIVKYSIVTLILFVFEALCASEKCQPNLLSNTVSLTSIIPKSNVISRKGDAGKICVIGGSIEYTGAPYFAAITALRTGADLVYVITTESAAPAIKSYSPDLIVYPHLNIQSSSKLTDLLKKMDVVVIGPGLGRDTNIVKLTIDIIRTCKELTKPLVIDADGLYVVSKNPHIIENYPSPGLIMTPNKREADYLIASVPGNNTIPWYSFWGEFVSVLVKGEKDSFLTLTSDYHWSRSQSGSSRRVGGQGDILAGSLAVFYNWALKQQLCESKYPINLAQSLATLAAAKMVRTCNAFTFALHGRSMLASDMITQIHPAFEDVFTNP